ncbi:exopolyphosphatase, partial [Breznakiellaceae bacterium SP9]
MSKEESIKLITGSDFDGLACGTILAALGLVDEWQFVHPKDIQDGLIKATENDIVANVPYIKGCKLWFDHHSSEAERLGNKVHFEGVSRSAPSCARVIYDYYGGAAKLGHLEEMVRYTDKMDSADLTIDEIMNPKGWVLLGFLIDPRTGLGRIRNFTISNLDLMKKLAQGALTQPISDILAMPDVKERVDVYFEQNARFISTVKKRGTVEGNAIVIDWRGVSE